MAIFVFNQRAFGEVIMRKPIINFGARSFPACQFIARLLAFLMIWHTLFPPMALSKSLVAPLNSTRTASAKSALQQTASEVALVRHAPDINSGRIEGSVRQLIGENLSLEGTSVITGDLLVPGMPAVQINGRPSFAGVIEGSGSPLPSGYQVTLGGNAVLRHLITRTDPVPMDGIAAPPAPAGTRDVVLSKPSDSAGDFSTIRNLTLTGKAAPTAVPPGTYGSLRADSHTTFVLGVVDSSQPVIYNLQQFTLTGGSQLRLAGPVIINVLSGVTIEGSSYMGEERIPLWLSINIAAGGLIAAGKGLLFGIVRAPQGTVTIAGNSELTGLVFSDRLAVNGNGILKGMVGDTTPPIITIDEPEEGALISELQVTVSGTYSDENATTVTINSSMAVLDGNSYYADVPLSLGPNTLNVVARDAFGNTSTASRNVTRTDNQPPVINAGQDQTITLPGAATLNGNASDDGLPVGSTLSINWSKVSGPGTVTFSSPNAAVTTATFSSAGSYVLRLTASDSQFSRSDDVAVTVIAANQPPAVIAGPDQTITLPNSATLNGTVTDDGLPAGSSITINWIKVSGPGTVTFSNPDAAITTASFSVTGNYILRLSATDSQLTGNDDVSITVNPANQGPVVNAGSDQSITLPNSAALNGTVTDDGLPTGSALTISWSKLSGPGTVTFSNPNAVITTAEFSEAGSYVLKLTATDSELTSSDEVTITVNQPNQPPVVNAGADQTITLPNGANLNGTVTDDGLPAGSSPAINWSKVSGPGTVTFSNASSATTTATFSQSGVYVLKLTASDSELTSNDEVTVTVIQPNQAPQVNAGSDQSITLPNSAGLNGTVTDDGLPAGSTLSIAWSKVSGPGTVTFGNASSASTTASFSEAGVYLLRLTASDSELTSGDEVTITVNQPNQPPSVNAGPDQSITLPATANLNGTVSDDGLPSGSTLSITWNKVSGPGTVTFSNATAAITTAAFSAAGVYILRLIASDSELTSQDEVTITVNPANQSPLVNAGPDQSITLPDSATLNGTASDDGLPLGSTLTVSWSKVSGPGTVTFSAPNSTVTTASFSTGGEYVLRLTASDSQFTSSDDVNISVTLPPNQPPVVNAGLDQTTTLGDNLLINGGNEFTLANGKILGWREVTGSSWTQAVSGINGFPASFEGRSFFYAGNVEMAELSQDLDVSAFAAAISSGNQQFEFKGYLLSFNQTPADTARIVVEYRDASNSNVLSVFDSGQVASVTGWMLVSDSRTAPAGTGWIRIRLIATRNSGGSNDAYFDGLSLRAIPAAGESPVTTATVGLTGTASDDGLPVGSSLTSNWSKLSGPGQVTFGDANKAATTATFSVSGTYELRLTATDSELTSSDDLSITVDPAPAPNQAPVVNAGADQTITLPDIATLSGTATDDGLPLGSTLSITWSKVSGPGTVTFSNLNAASTTASFSEAGTYVLRLSASDSLLTASDDLTITVNAAGPANQAPVVNAGPDKTTLFENNLLQNPGYEQLPTTSTPPGWTIVSGTWNRGPINSGFPAAFEGTGYFAGGGAVGESELRQDIDLSAFAPSIAAGNQRFQFRGYTRQISSSPLNATRLVVEYRDATNTTVLASFNSGSLFSTQSWLQVIDTSTAPAGTSWVRVRLIAINNSTGTFNNFAFFDGLSLRAVSAAAASLQGSVTDDGLPAGSTLTTTWSKVSGPGNVSFSNTSSASTNAIFSSPGSYLLRLTATDSQLSGSDEVAVTVNSINQPPAVNAGPDQTIIFENNLLQNPGYEQPPTTSTPPGWTIVSGTWNRGPINSGFPAPFEGMGYFAGGGTVGETELRQDIDISAFASSIAAGNQRFQFEGYTRQLNSSPANATKFIIEYRDSTNSTLLASFNSDPLLSTQSWLKVANTSTAPAGTGWVRVRLIAVNNTTSSLNNFALFDTLSLRPVSAAQVNLSGVISDDGLPASSTPTAQWSKVSGPGSVTFGSPNSSTTTAAFSSGGIYILRLTASDSDLSSSDELTITINDTNLPPIVNAGPDQAILFENNLLKNPGFEDLSAGSTPPGWTVVSGTWNRGPINSGFPNPVEGTGYFVGGGAAGESELRQDIDLSVLATAIAAGGQSFSFDGYTCLSSTTASIATRILIEYRDATNSSVLDSFDTGALSLSQEWSKVSNLSTAPAGTGWIRVRLLAINNTSGSLADFALFDGLSIRPLLASQVELKGTASDDGLPANSSLSFAWSKVSGPGPVIFGNPNSLATTAAFTVKGRYTLRLSVSDSRLTGSDDVVVDFINQTPVVDAGPDQTITSFPNTATLNGSATDDGLPEGSTLSLTWSKVSGPGTVTFSSPNSLLTTADFSIGGRYVLRLSASDSQLAGSDDVALSVLLPNQPPAVNAGPDRSITIPEGTIVFSEDFENGPFQWEIPGSMVITSTTSASPSHSQTFGNVANGGDARTYLFSVTPGQTYYLHVAYMTLGGGGYIGLDLPPFGEQWLIGDGGDRTNLSQFDYNIFEQNAENLGVWKIYTQAYTISPDVNTIRIKTEDFQFGLPNDPTNKGVFFDNIELSTSPTPSFMTVSLNGTVNDETVPEGSNLAISWSKESGPGEVTFSNPDRAISTATFSEEGTYVLRLTATDSVFTVSDEITVTIIVNNRPPSVDAGPDQTIILPNNIINLNGTVSDDGLPAGAGLSISWSKLSGPGEVIFSNPVSSATTATFSTAGTYVVKLTASDSQYTRSDYAIITVNPVDPNNQAPVVNAGADQSITLPTNSVSLNGTVSDDGLPSGIPLSITWSKGSGPGTVTFSNASAAITNATFSAAGTYVVRLSASDSQYTSSDEVTITVNPAIQTNQAPVVNAGADQTITLPTNNVRLSGTVTDDGLPAGSTVTIEWSQVSGPGSVTFSEFVGVAITATFSAAGVYVLRLSASDGELSSSDEVTVTVNAANQAPVVNAGVDQTITLPTNSVNLNGTVTDDGLPTGSSLTISWSKISGAGTVTFGNANSAITTAEFSEAGTYVLRLTASDGELTGSDEVTITVNTELPPPPTVAITSPVDGASITDRVQVIGTVSNGSWNIEYALNTDEENAANLTWVSFATGTGPTSGVLATFDPTILLNGSYAIRLTAIDEAGQKSSFTISTVVEKNLKIGNFTFSFNDLSVPVAGLLIQLIRTYDSRDKRVGDFGVGWTLDIKNVRLEKSSVLGKFWEETLEFLPGGIPRYCLQPTRPKIVTITFPNGKVFKFQAKANPECQISAITSATISYVALPGTQGTLVPMPEDNVDVTVSGSVPGLVDLIDVSNSRPYNPTLFKLTTVDGDEYIIDQRGGLQKVTDLNGNTLTISSSGIIHSSGKSVTFTRDSQGRITQITDPMGNFNTYSYDANGDLQSFKDRENNTTTHGYDSRHGLLSIQDPRGITPIRNEYDDSGRLIRHTDAFGKTITYTHNLDTKQEVIADRLGNPTVYEYDANGNVLKVTDAVGAVTTFTYDTRDNKLTETNALGKTTTFTYDERDNLLTQTDPLGNTTSFTYNSRRQVLTITDPRNAVTTNTYNSKGNLISTRDPMGNTSTFTYTEIGGLRLSETDVLNGVTRFEYDGFGNVTKVIDALNHETVSTYDTNGNQLTQNTTRTNGGVLETLTTSYQYDKLGRLIQTTYADGTTTRVEYNAIGKQSKTIDQLGRETSYSYNSMGQLTRVTYPDLTAEESTYDAEGRRLSSKDREGNITGFAYDAVGRLTKTTYPDLTSTTTGYDQLGRVVTTKDALNQTTTYEYDPNCGCSGRRTRVIDAESKATSFTYDQNGNQLTATDANDHTTSYEYDLNNRRTKVRYQDATEQTTTFDTLGRTTAQTDQDGKTTQFEYDKLGRLVKVKDALNQITQYSYNEVSEQITQTDALNRTTRYEHDKLGRRTKRILPLGQTESYGYNAVGNLISRIDFNGKITTYTYDNVNRLLSKIPDASFGQSPITFTYTPIGRRATMTDGSGTTNYSYNNRGRLLSKQTPQGMLNYTYNTVGNILTARSSNPNGLSVDYSYDVLNRLRTVTDNGLGTTQNVTTYSYDNVGNLASEVLPNGVESNYTYNSLNRLTNLTVAKGTTNLASYAYTLGRAGNRLSVAELSGRTVSYSYDAVYRLTNETIAGASTGTQNGSISYTYDAVGNRLSRTSTVAAILSQQNINYDNNDRLSSDGYDDNGNTINSDGKVYSYDYENHLVSVTGNGISISIVYDGDGNRVSKTVNGITTKYLVDTNNHTGYAQVVEEIQSGNVVRQYTYGHDLISQRQQIDGNLVTGFYGYDGHGSVRFLTDSTGVITDQYDYDAFGNLIQQTGSTPNNYLYAGEQFDPDLGLYYNRARYLNVGIGRFWTQDEFEGDIESPASLHKYLYAHADPINNVDPSGNFVYGGGELHSRNLQTGIGARIQAEQARLGVQVVRLARAELSTEVSTISVGQSVAASGLLLLSTLSAVDEFINTVQKRQKFELFFRAMSTDEYVKLVSNGGLSVKSGSPAREIFVTQNIAYALTVPFRFKRGGDYEVLVVFIMRQGTKNTLTANGAISASALQVDPSLFYLPYIGSIPPSQVPNVVHIKGEQGGLNYGLRRGSVGLFNSNIIAFQGFSF
jgi:RHS repeat-associated protein